MSEVKTDPMELERALADVRDLQIAIEKEGWTRQKDDLLERANKAAELLGARAIDFHRIDLSLITDPAKRQERFERILGDGIGEDFNLSEAQELKNEFGLRG